MIGNRLRAIFGLSRTSQVPSNAHTVGSRATMLAERYSPGWTPMALFYSAFALLSLICVRWLARRVASGELEEEAGGPRSAPQRLSSVR